MRKALTSIPITKQHGALAVKYPPVCLSGDHTVKVLPVPIPNTEVKLYGPMIVHTSVKVGIAGFLKPFVASATKGFFYGAIDHKSTHPGRAGYHRTRANTGR